MQREVLAERIAARVAELGSTDLLNQEQIEAAGRLLLPVLTERQGVKLVSPLQFAS